MFKYKIPISNETEPDERRMSDLSDWAPSVTSSVDVQVGGFSLPSQFGFLGIFLVKMLFNLAICHSKTRTMNVTCCFVSLKLNLLL